MAIEFRKEKSWVWLQDFKMDELNGKLGQIVGFDGVKQCYQVFVPGLRLDKVQNKYKFTDFTKDLLKNAILVKKQDDRKIRTLFHEFSSGLLHTAIPIKDENLQDYVGNLVECQFVPPGKDVFRYGENTPKNCKL